MPIIRQKPAAVILAMDETMRAMIPFDQVPSMLKEEMYLYEGKEGDQGGLSIPMIYMVRDEVIETLFLGQKISPSSVEEKGIRKYKTYQLEGISMETRAHYVLGDSRYEAGLVPFISGINETTINCPLIYDFKHPYSGSSDHVSYSDKGIPSFFFFSGSHKDLHQAGDDPEKIEYDKAVKLSRLAYLITMELANMDEVPDFLE